ncbi:hypothetical protein B0H10DRAFT_2443473 [Mycena sp. CBHHK59/15]|nr:hypothetical protein B0H10DRAFT_2443473 [Mycena sp. CBHHK59/15]
MSSPVHYHETFVPDILDWAAHLREPFTAANHPDFKPTIEDLWAKYFGGSAYQFTDAVEFLAGALIGNWRSDIGKRAVKLVKEKLEALPSTAARRKWVADQMYDVAFLYRDPKSQTGSYRSELFLRVFGGAHLRVYLKNEVSFGFPIGAALLVAAALERAFALCKDGSLSTEGIQRKGRKKANSFVPVPWAERAARYLPPIETLTPQKWHDIIALAAQFMNSKDSAPLFDDNSTDAESADGYTDPRSNVVISDDEPEEDEDNSGGPSGMPVDDLDVPAEVA